MGLTGVVTAGIKVTERPRPAAPRPVPSPEETPGRQAVKAPAIKLEPASVTLDSLIDPATREKVAPKLGEARQAVEILQRLTESDSRKEAAARKVAYLKQRLEVLKQAVDMLGPHADRRAAAAVAKELAQLAKDLAQAAKDYAEAGGKPDMAAVTGGAVSVPVTVTAGQQGGGAAAAQPAEAGAAAAKAESPEVTEVSGQAAGDGQDPAAQVPGVAVEPQEEASPAEDPIRAAVLRMAGTAKDTREARAKREQQEQALDRFVAEVMRGMMAEIKKLFTHVARLALRDAPEDERRQMEAATDTLRDADRTLLNVTAPLMTVPLPVVDVKA